MKKLLFIPILLLFCLTASAMQPYQAAMMVCKGASAPACTTPSGDELTESFGEGSTSCWTSGSSVCNNTWTKYSSPTISIENTPSGAADNTACAKSFKIDTTSSVGHIYKDMGDGVVAYNAASVHKLHLYITSVTDIAQYSLIRIWAFNNNTASISDGTNRYFTVSLYKSTSGTGTPNQITVNNSSSCGAFALDTHYELIVTLDAEGAAGGSSMTVNGGAACTFTRGAVASRYVLIGSGSTGTVGYFGYTNVSTP